MRPLHVAIENGLTDDECGAAIAQAEEQGLGPATVYGEVRQVDRRVRHALTSRHDPGVGGGWLSMRIDALFAEGAAALGVRVAPIAEAYEIVRYDPGCHFATWHTDGGGDLAANRLLSLSIELSPLSAHDGGALEIIPDLLGPRTLPLGGARVFFSRALHHVSPVTRGSRWALVAWTGPGRS